MQKGDPYSEMSDEQLYAELKKRAEDIGMTAPDMKTMVAACL